MLPGCSAFAPLQEDVTITATYPGAQIYVDDTGEGTSPVTVSLDRNQTHLITDSAGETMALGRHVSVTGVLDIGGAILFLVPIIGCFTPGFWSLDSTDIQLKPAAY